MATMTRTDIHRPSAPEFDPENYSCFGVFDLNPEWGSVGRVELVSRLVDQGWSFRGAPHGSGQCSHCGAHIRYAALMGHEPTKTLLYIGETCLDNRFSLTKPEFDRLRKEAALNATQRSMAANRADFLATHPDLVWASYAHNIDTAGATIEWVVDWYDETTYATEAEAQAVIDAMPEWKRAQYQHPWMETKRGTTWGEKTRMGSKTATLSDMWSRFYRYGDMSDKAYAYLQKILVWLDEAEQKRVERESATAALQASGVEVPTGRIVVEGEVLSTKWVENGFGGALKMLVQHESGWKVWGTVPSSIDVEKGTRIRFTASVERSNDDALFGFFKRPAKAQVL